MRQFWKSLLHTSVSFTTLSDNLNKIETGITQAEKVYRMVLERYPQSVKLVRNYAKFLEHVRNDPVSRWTVDEGLGERPGHWIGGGTGLCGRAGESGRGGWVVLRGKGTSTAALGCGSAQVLTRVPSGCVRGCLCHLCHAVRPDS